MASQTGKGGTLFIDDVEVSPITTWELTVNSSNKAYAANDTAGWRKRLGGIKDSSGMFVIHVDTTGNAPLDEGDMITLKLHVDNTGNNYYTVPAIVDEIKTNLNINDTDIVVLQIKFSGNGVIIKNGILAKAV